MLLQSPGFMVSEWGAVHSTVNAANYGLDLEMPNQDFFNQKLIAAVKAGRVPVIDDKVRRILRVMMWAVPKYRRFTQYLPLKGSKANAAGNGLK